MTDQSIIYSNQNNQKLHNLVNIFPGYFQDVVVYGGITDLIVNSPVFLETILSRYQFKTSKNYLEVSDCTENWFQTLTPPLYCSSFTDALWTIRLMRTERDSLLHVEI